MSAHLDVIQSRYNHHSSNTETKQDPYFSLTTYNLTSNIIFLSNVLNKIGLFLLSCQLSAQLLYMWAVLLLKGNNITCYLWFLEKFTQFWDPSNDKTPTTEVRVDRILFFWDVSRNLRVEEINISLWTKHDHNHTLILTLNFSIHICN